MADHDTLAGRFEADRAHLHGVAYRLLGSPSEADDAVQEAWIRLARSDVSGVENLTGWLTTVVSRICLDMLRSREARREDLSGRHPPEAHRSTRERSDPEREAALVDAVGRALLVVLSTLTPAERVAFVLHDTLSMPFDEIAQVLGRSTVATKKLASRARGKVRGTPTADPATLGQKRRVVEAFLAASRAGDVDAVLAVLAPDVVRRGDPAALPAGRAQEARGAEQVAKEVAVFGKSARFADLALVDGELGVVVAPHGRLRLVIKVTVDDDRVTAYDLVGDPARLRQLSLSVLDG